MGLENRNRDFTSSTISELHQLLAGPKEPSREFTTFWRNHGECFDFDASGDCQTIDKTVTDLRYWMSDVAPAQLKEIDTKVHEIDRIYTGQCQLAAEEAEDLKNTTKMLAEAISKPDFSVNFDVDSIRMILMNDPTSFTAQRLEFIQGMMNQYGFDRKTARIMWNVWLAIQTQFPDASQEELDWYFARALSALIYDDNEFNMAAGIAYSNAYVFFVHVLGLSPEDYQYLLFMVQLQHKISSDPNGYSIAEMATSEAGLERMKEIFDWANGTFGFGWDWENAEDRRAFIDWYDAQYNNMCTGADFAHQQVILATHLAKNLGKTSPLMWFVDIKAHVGWLGDVTMAGGVMGNDDYKADLDAANIAYLMYQVDPPLSLQEATAQYYADLKNGRYTRASKFKEHTSLQAAAKQIGDWLGVTGTYEEMMESFKKDHPTAYNFLKNLENNNNDLESYI